MGWLYSSNWYNKKALVNHILNDDTYHKALKHRLNGNNLWAVFENTNPECPVEHRRYICLFLLGCQRNYGWGYKDISESMGPYQVDCPVSFFDLVPDPGGFATEWRAKVRAAHIEKLAHDKLIRSLQCGVTVNLKHGVNPTQLKIVQLKPMRATAGNGVIYRLRPGLIASIA